MFVSTFTYMSIWVYTGEVGAKRLREAYLQAVLRQDIAFFDNVGAGEVATRIQTDTRDLFPHPWDFTLCLFFMPFCRSCPARNVRKGGYGRTSFSRIRNRRAHVF